MLAQRLDQRRVLLVGLEGFPVVVQHHRIDQMATGGAGAGVDKILGTAAIPPEAPGDQQQQTEPEEEAAFPLKARFTEYFFE